LAESNIKRQAWLRPRRAGRSACRQLL